MADEYIPVGNSGNKKKLLDLTTYVAEVVAVILQAGSAIIGKVRLVDSGGGEVTEAVGHSVKTTVVGPLGPAVSADSLSVVLASDHGAVGTSDTWHPIVVADTDDNDSDKTFTVPADTEYQLLSILVDLVTSADAGDRQLTVLITTAADVVIAEIPAGVVQAASLTRRYTFGVGNPDLLAFRDTATLLTPLPVLVLPAGYKIRIYDNNAVAAAADDMDVQMLVLSRAV